MARLKNACGALAATALLLAPAASFARATIVINNQNAIGEGFNDPTPAAPVGGNPGVTVGEQRLIAFEYAASIWGATLVSNQTIVIDAKFSALQCDAKQGVLGSAAPESEEMADSTFPDQTVWYPSALANAFAGADFAPGEGDIVANFNENVGSSTCLPGSGWYYGIDGKAPAGMNDLPTVLLHEFSHGLGFLTYADQSGVNLQSKPDVFEKYAFDDQLNKLWINMTDSERAASTLHPESVVWTGSNVKSAVPAVLNKMVVMSITAPAGNAADLTWAGAEFAPNPTVGFNGTVVQVKDASGGSATDACGAVTGVSGKIALVDRLPQSGSYTPCTFKTKAKNVQAAGAIGMVVDDYPNDSSPPGGMADDTSVKTTITIPSVFVSNDSGNKLKNALAAGTTTVAFRENGQYAGADTNGAPYLFTPASYQAGSSVSHWSLDASGPSLLMEPYIHSDIPRGLDLTPAFMKDIGWTLGPDVTVALAKAGPVEAWPGGKAHYLISVLNHGNTAATNVTVNAATPAGLTLESVSGAGCTAFPCTVGNVPADSSATLLATYSIPLGYTTPDPVVENVSISFNGSSSDSTSFTSAVQQAADVEVTATAPSEFNGDQQSIPVTVINHGPSVAMGVDVAGDTPSGAGVQFVGFNGDCTGSTCHFDSLQPGESKSLNMLVKVSGDKQASFRVGVTVTTTDPDLVNNEAMVKANVASGCTAPGGASFLSLVVLAGGLLLRRRQSRA